MMSWRRLPLFTVFLISTVCVAVWTFPSAHATGADASEQPSPRVDFSDPQRRTKLASSFKGIDHVFVDFARRENIPGAAWGIVVDGQLAHVGTTGYRDVTTKAVVEPNTVFRIASMTKSFTAMAVLKLREAGRLQLDDLAEKHVPELAGLKYPTSDSPRLTIRHLMSHAAGFPEDNPWGDQQLAATDADMSAMLRAGIPFSNAPGIRYEYSNFGFAILGRIVTNVSKMPYRDYVQSQILKPLGMEATTLEPKEVPVTRLARGYRWEDQRWKEEPQLPDGAFGAMGGMLTSIDDLAAYVAVFLRAWPPSDGPQLAPISRAALREMQQTSRSRASTVTRAADGTTQLNAGGYGFGLGITETCRFGHVVAHSGGLPGFGSQMRWLPEYGVGIVAMGNRTYTGWGEPFNAALELLDETGGLQARQAQPSPALVQAKLDVSRLMVEWDDTLADRIAAVNLYLDRSKDRRKREFDQMRAKVGTCKAEAPFVLVENALRGRWTLSCERGDVGVAITLAPTTPPTIQFLEIGPAQSSPRQTCP